MGTGRVWVTKLGALGDDATKWIEIGSRVVALESGYYAAGGGGKDLLLQERARQPWDLKDNKQYILINIII